MNRSSVESSSRTESDPDAEKAVLLHCARLEMSEDHRACLREAVVRVSDWDHLLSRAERHGMTPLVARHLREHAGGRIATDVLTRLEETAISIAKTNLAELADLLRIVAALESHGVTAIPIKGPVLAIRVYGDLALRTFADLDLLVRREEVLRALEVLADLGYRPHAAEGWRPSIAEHVLRFGNEIPLENRDSNRMIVDLHWRLFPSRFALSLEDLGLFERLETMEVGGRRIRCMGDEDLLLYLIHHGYRHGWNRLEWLCGMSEIVRQRGDLDWDTVLRRARHLGMGRAVEASLALSERILGAPVPFQHEKRLGDGRTSDLVRDLEERLWAPSGDRRRAWRSSFLEARGLDRPLDRARLLFRLATVPTSADWNWVALKKLAAPAYFAVRLVRIVVKYVRSVIRGPAL